MPIKTKFNDGIKLFGSSDSGVHFIVVMASITRNPHRKQLKQSHWMSSTALFVFCAVAFLYFFEQVSVDYNDDSKHDDLSSSSRQMLSLEMEEDSSSSPRSHQVPAKLNKEATTTIIGAEGGAWTAGTHITQYGFNVDAGLIRVLEAACRDIENARNTPDSQWSPHPSNNAPIGGFWRAPKVVDCRVLELGSGVGIYVDSLKKDQGKRKRKVFGIEPNPMGGVYERKNGPRQLAIDILSVDDTFALAKHLLKEHLNGEAFDLLYSIEVCEHMPPERHLDAAKFLAGLSRPNTKLIFGAAHPRQGGTGHIGNRAKGEWESILEQVGFEKEPVESLSVAHELDEYNHKVNTQVYYFQEPKSSATKK